MKRLNRLFLLLVTAALAAGAFAAEPPLEFAVGLFQPDKDKNDATYRPLADYLSARLDRPVELRTVDSWEGLAKSLANGETDVALMGPWGYNINSISDRNRGVLAPTGAVSIDCRNSAVTTAAAATTTVCYFPTSARLGIDNDNLYIVSSVINDNIPPPDQLVLVIHFHQLESRTRAPALLTGKLNIGIIQMLAHPRFAGPGSSHSVKYRF